MEIRWTLKPGDLHHPRKRVWYQEVLLKFGIFTKPKWSKRTYGA